MVATERKVLCGETCIEARENQGEVWGGEMTTDFACQAEDFIPRAVVSQGGCELGEDSLDF